MPRITAHLTPGTTISFITDLMKQLHTMFLSAGYKHGACVTNHVFDNTTESTPPPPQSRQKCGHILKPAPFLELVCDPRHVPKILRGLIKDGIYWDIEIDKLDSLFITAEQLYNEEWEGLLRERLYQKSFIAREAKVFLLDNLKLFLAQFSQEVIPDKDKDRFEANAIQAMDAGGILYVKENLRMDMTYLDCAIWNKFLSIMKKDLDQLAILAGIG